VTQYLRQELLVLIICIAGLLCGLPNVFQVKLSKKTLHIFAHDKFKICIVGILVLFTICLPTKILTWNEKKIKFNLVFYLYCS
jgi:hypothetical protein